MGNLHLLKKSKLYRTKSRPLDNGSQEGADGGTQRDLCSSAHDYNFTNLATAEEKQGGAAVEDIEVKPMMITSWKGPISIDLNISTEPLLKERPSEEEWSVPISLPVSISPPSVDKGLLEKPWKSEILAEEVDDKNKDEDNNGKNEMVGNLLIKEAADVLPPMLGFHSGIIPNIGPLYPLEMDSVGTQLTEFPTIWSDCSHGSHITYQEQLGDQGTIGANQILKATAKSATSQSRSLANSISTALKQVPKKTQPPDDVLIPLDGSDNTKQTAKTYSLFGPSALERIKGRSRTQLPINPPGIQDGEAEKMTQETADTHRTTRANPSQYESMSKPQPSPCNVQEKSLEEAQSQSVKCFTYADVLKRSLKVPPQRGALKPPGKDGGRQKKSSMGKHATTEVASLSNRRLKSENAKNPATRSSRKIINSSNPTRPLAPPFNFSKEQPTSSHQNPKDYFQFKGSRNVAKPQVFTPNDSMQFGKRNKGKNKVRHTDNSGSSGTIPKTSSISKPQEQSNPHKVGHNKKVKGYQSYTIARSCKPPLAFVGSPAFTRKEPVKSRAVASIQIAEFILPDNLSRKNKLPTALEPHVQNGKSDQIRKCEASQQLPKVKPGVPQSTSCFEVTEDTEISSKEHGDTFSLSNPGPTVPNIKETEGLDSSDQIPNQSLVVWENEPASEPSTILKVPDVTNDPIPDVALKRHVSGRWKDFYMDNMCTMKCRCRHRPGELPPNVVRWFSVLEKKVAEPEWITTLKVMSSLVAGTKFAMDCHASYVLEKSRAKPKNQPQ